MPSVMGLLEERRRQRDRTDQRADHVNGPTTIRLQGIRSNAVGTASVAQIYSDAAGRTSLRYDRVGP
jgi:hypothetical protein